MLRGYAASGCAWRSAAFWRSNSFATRARQRSATAADIGSGKISSLPRSRTTTQAPDYPCSVTAYGPTFHTPADAGGAWTQDYGASTSCQGGVGSKTLTVYDQVQGAKGVWFTIAGSQVTVGPTTNNPVRIIRTRTAVLGHTYRTVALAHLVVPNGFAGCSLHQPPACQETIDIKAVTTPIAP
jgi:hypothetical protein